MKLHRTVLPLAGALACNVALAGLLMVMAPTVCAAAPLALENDWFRVSIDSASGTFSLTEKAGGRVVLNEGQWANAKGPAALEPVSDPAFGQGQALVLAGGKLMVFPKLPFALFRATLSASGPEPALFNRVPLVSATVAVPGDLKSMGTGGLQAPKDNPGSYAWLAIADPETRHGIVGAWLTHDRGSGVVFSPVTNGSVRIAAQVDYGRLRAQPGTPLETETFALGYFADARLGLEAYADAVAQYYGIKLLPKQSGFCTWYTEKHSRACDESNLVVLAAYAAKELKPFGFDFVQIDDGWQLSGRVFEGENPKGPYRSGMKATADNISRLGLTPGLWFIPFAGNAKHQAFLEHQDRFYKDQAGKPFDARWGGTCLDMSVPETRDYLKKLIHLYAHDWGYKLFKMDGLWTGTGTRLMYVNNGYKWDEMGEAAPADPDKTQIENYRTGLKLVRETAGPSVFLLGCCVSQNMRSFGGAFGLVDAMRVGPDTGAGHIGAPHASRNYFLNGRVWWNDPDCVSVRAKTPLEQARVNASFTAISGALFYNSDWMPDLPAERLEILKRTLAPHYLPVRPVDYFENDPARIWHLAAKDRDIVALFNWGSAPMTIACDVQPLGLPAAREYVAFDFWNNRFLPPFHGELKTTLAPGSCRVLAIRPVAPQPQLLSTSRHVTQGMLDVLEEKWDSQAMTLSGASRLVANDPYELRVVVPVGQNSWHALPPARQEGPNVRLALTNATSAEVKWQLRFERAAVQSAPPLVEETVPTALVAEVPRQRPPTPPAPNIYLDALKPIAANNGWGKLGVNKSIQGDPLALEGKQYEHGLGCHANSLLVYQIPAGAKRFVALVGLDDEKKDDERSSVTFEVYGDVKEMGEAPELLAKSPVLSAKTLRSWTFNVEFNERHKELRLRVTDAGDGIASDHADWLNAGFVTK